MAALQRSVNWCHFDPGFPVFFPALSFAQRHFSRTAASQDLVASAKNQHFIILGSLDIIYDVLELNRFPLELGYIANGIQSWWIL